MRAAQRREEVGHPRQVTRPVQRGLPHPSAPAYPLAEQDDMRQQREELVQPDTVAPVGFQRAHLLVAGNDGVVVRAAEQREHRQVGLAVTSVRGRVDQHHPVGCPHHVAAPQVAVQPGRFVVVIRVEVARAAALGDGVDRGTGRSIEPRRRELGHRGQPLVGVEVAPASVLAAATSATAAIAGRRTLARPTRRVPRRMPRHRRRA